MHVDGSPGEWPGLRNVTRYEVQAFREQIKVVAMSGKEDARAVARQLQVIAEEACPCSEYVDETDTQISTVQRVQAEESEKVTLDLAGYFVIFPQENRDTILVEHYSNENELRNVVEGNSANEIFRRVYGLTTSHRLLGRLVNWISIFRIDFVAENADVECNTRP